MNVKAFQMDCYIFHGPKTTTDIYRIPDLWNRGICSVIDNIS